MDSKHNPSQSSGRQTQSAAPNTAVQNDLATRSAHTPGPWKLAAHVADPCTVYIEQAEGEEPGICTTDGSAFTPVDSENEQEANARLIAAAPDMLASLKYLLMVRSIKCQHSSPAPDSICANCQALAAIAKAEGR